MNFIIKNRQIKTENDEKLISYNKDYIARFSFDEEWDGTIKTARFIQDNQHTDVVLSDDQCEMPALENGIVKIGVFNKTMTSTYVLLKVSKSIKDDSGNPAEPEPDVYAQLISLIQSGMLKGEAGYTPVKGEDYFTDEEVEEIIGRADVFSQNAEKSAAAAATSERNAALSEQAAKESAERSAESASAADASKRSAEEAAKAAKASEDNAAASETAAKKSETAAAESAKNADDSATAAEKSKTDAQTLVDNFGSTVKAATTGAVNTVNETKDNAVNTVNALLDTIPEDYTAMTEDVDELKSDIVNKIDAPENPTVGKILKIKSINEDGTFVCEWADDESGAVDDVKIDGQSIIGEDSVATIPLFGGNGHSWRLFKQSYNTYACGLAATSDGIYTMSAGYTEINNRIPVDSRTSSEVGANRRHAINPCNLDYAVKAAMCDGKGEAWTAEEQAMARARMGTDEYELIANLTLSEGVKLLSINPLDHKSVYVVFKAPKAEKDMSIYFWFYSQDTSLNPASTYLSKAYNVAERTSAFFAIDYGKMRRFGTVMPAPDNRTVTCSSFLPMVDTSGLNITTIYIKAMDEALLPGTIISVYGKK